MKRLALIAALLLPAALPALAAPTAPQRSVRIIEKAMPSVVVVTVGKGTGSGFAVDGGYLVTCRHVVRAEKKVTVRTRDGRTLEAEVVAVDEGNDLALLKADGLELPALPLADELPKVGATVYALGNPYKFAFSASRGMVSALGRELHMPDGTTLTDMIQTDAPINPGNSGGPLLDRSGRVVGVNAAIVLGADGMGFAVPAARVRELLAKVK